MNFVQSLLSIIVGYFAINGYIANATENDGHVMVNSTGSPSQAQKWILMKSFEKEAFIKSEIDALAAKIPELLKAHIRKGETNPAKVKFEIKSVLIHQFETTHSYMYHSDLRDAALMIRGV